MKDGPIVLDSCVLVSALRSKRGASYRLLRQIGTGRFETSLSLPMFLEYEDVSARLIGQISLTKPEIDDVLNFIAQSAKAQTVFFL